MLDTRRVGWDFCTDAETQTQLDWVDTFVREEVEPLDFVIDNARDVRDPIRQELIPPLQAVVRERGLWSAHLEPKWGGQGCGHLHLALLEEILGRSRTAPMVFGCQSPDSGNAQIIARYGTAEQRGTYLQPLLDGHIVSCFSATEPQSGADPKMYTTSAHLDGDEWVISGEKWFSSGLEYSAFAIVMAVTDPDAGPYHQLSAFFVPTDKPGIEVIRNVSVGNHTEPIHSYVRYDDVRVAGDSLLGDRGDAFAVMQTRMSHARLSLATRSLGQMRRAIDLMAERAVSRTTQGELLANKQLVQDHIANSKIEFEMFRLLVLRTAWLLDRMDFKAARADIAAVKVMLPKVMADIGRRAAQIHGSLGVSDEMPFVGMVNSALAFGVADGPTEVHKMTVARALLHDAKPASGLFPSYHLPERREAARERYAEVLARHGRRR